MKKLFIAFVLTSALFSCEKETSTPNNSGNNTTDTTKTSNDVSISGFDCEGVQITGTLTKDKVASNVTATISYTGGNGKTYLTKSHTSTGVTGLSATLLAGTLSNGEGTLVYTISGTPTSTGTANFSISIGGQTCVFKLDVIDEVQVIGKPGPNITDIDGNSYKTVFIGNQQWMAENLKVSKYNDGTVIPNITDETQWSKLTTGAWAYYNNDSESNSKYGKLYNGYVLSSIANGNKNVCPTGWHVPNMDNEWLVLINSQGSFDVAGGKMKEVGTTSWDSPNTGATNTSLFTALPGGVRGLYGGFNGKGLNGWWMTSTTLGQETNNPVFIQMFSNSSRAEHTGGPNGQLIGASIRCVKD